jgi:hypothetical protein
MSVYYVRRSGNIYGPFSREQLSQMLASGRLAPDADVSSDRSAWMPAASIVGGGAQPSLPPASPGAADLHGAAIGSGAKQYLDRLRKRTQYPFYRTAVLVVTIIGYVGAVAPIVVLILRVAWNGLRSVEAYEPFAAVLGSALAAVFVTVMKEVASMFADFVDSTLMHHSKTNR